MAASSSIAAFPSTSAHSNSNHRYDVFINHRGPDVKKTFASYLYRRLLSHRVSVFLDHHELQGGDYLTSQIEAAITAASVHVAIFSPGYVESVWCLKELVLILETGATIIPVFYHVKPSDLKWTRGRNGLYAQHLHDLEKKKTYGGKARYDSTTIENWRNALSRVAGISGFELETCNSDEGELLEKVVEGVLKKVKKPLLNVAKHPTGLDEKMEDFENAVLSQQHRVELVLVGIVGLGGVGKTTLAKELFNRKSSHYSRSCFLSNVRENADKTSLILLQRQLLKSLTGSDPVIDSIDEGIETLKEHLSSSKALVILDDVDHEGQVYELLPYLQNLKDGLILITSRDKDVLLHSGVRESAIYKLTGLNAQHSRELFCSHAFSRPRSLPGYEYLVDKFLDVCDGLPLSLKVIGALLSRNYDRSFWEDQLDSLQQILPSDIELKLKLSYDTLNVEEQQIFLDIACFFIGENRDTAIRIWDGSGWKGLLRFQNLENKCLVYVNRENNIQMHHHLRDLGRHIEGASGLPRRLWRKSQNIDDLLQQSYVITEVRGITMAPTADSCVYTSANLRSEMPWYEKMSHEMFGNHMMKLHHTLRNAGYSFLGIGMRKLQLLFTEDRLLEPILSMVHYPNLIWLRWYKCPYSFLPSWIPMKNLRVFQVAGGELKTLWEDKSQVPLQLRELEISAPLWNIPNSIGLLKHLERIYMHNLEILRLPEEFCDLWSLKALELINCSKLKSLPDSFGNLTNLERIQIHGSPNLEWLPNSFGDLIRLKYLSVRACIHLNICSETLGRITTLEYADLSACPEMKVLPSEITDQRSLQKLYLWATSLTELPSAIGSLSNLEHLALEGPLLKVLPSSLGYLRNLKELTLWYCWQLRGLPDSVGLLTELTELTVVGCPLYQLPIVKVEQPSEEDGLYGLAKLQVLNISRCKRLKELPNIETLISLEVLRASDCVKLNSIRGLEQLSKLRELDVANCSRLKELPGVEYCISLERLDASGCPRLQWDAGVLEQLRQRVKVGFML